MTKGLLPFPWYGGKFSHLSWLLPLLPEADIFVDVFGGSGAVLLNRKPAAIEIYNDLDRDLVTFFRVLRDDPDPLLRAITLTPYSREEYRLACESDGDTDTERARRFFVRAVKSMAGRAQERRPSAWSYSATDISRFARRTEVWARYPDRLAVVAQRLLKAQIECRPAIDIIAHCDSRSTLFYCDPPYVHSTRNSDTDYKGEMSDDNHRELAEALAGIEGRAAVSGYRSELYDQLFDGWHRTDGRATVPSSSRHGAEPTVRQECLWTNYNPAEASGQPSLF